MTGPKLNEASYIAGERTGVKASAKYVRSSAYKARAVLNIVRGLPVRQADEVLQFTDREVGGTIRKVLASAVANAVHNDELDPESLYIKACFADEGPTLKRFRPRARGRASRIRKRTAHITIVLGVLDDAKLEIVQARDARRTAAGRRRGTSATGAASRQARVARSRERAAGLKGGVTDETVDETVDEIVDTGTAQSFAGSVAAVDTDDAPEGYEIKGNAQSLLYHVPGSRYYKATKAEYWFDSVENAEAAGFSAPGSKNDDADEAETEEGDA